ncbi:unnamed protein product [Darwinula stevensoni]|uniref:Uncharacterized protein n=1 Tax=Darwinula stevensoni TaxID=69355 RepID=A0A7R8XAR0_9CRUS|nr:unnamed protein product [Darwinula stevensoni]CAG0885734.1 unnamed protein product [Darwinula stevensoni]
MRSALHLILSLLPVLVRGQGWNTITSYDDLVAALSDGEHISAVFSTANCDNTDFTGDPVRLSFTIPSIRLSR